MNKSKKYIFSILIVLLVIVGTFALKGKIDDYIINHNATYLKTYEGLEKAGYEEVEEQNYIDVVSDYFENTNIETDRIMFMKTEEDGLIDYFMASGTKKVPQVLLKLETNLSDISELVNTDKEIVADDVLEEIGDDKYKLSVYSGDNVERGNSDISNTFAEFTFTLKSILGGAVGVESFNSEGCTAGTMDFSDETGGAYEQTSDSCKKIFDTSDFTTFLTDFFTSK